MKNINITYLDDYKPLLFKIAKVNLHFDLDIEKTIVTSKLHIKYNKQNSIFLNGENLDLQEISINKKNLKLNKDYIFDESGITLLNLPKEFELITKVIIYPKDNTDLQGLYASGETLCSKCETIGFRRITFFPDRPDALARFTVTIDADKTMFPVLLSNGNLKKTKKLSKNKHRVIWNDPTRKACYLFAIVAGNFEIVNDTFKTMSSKKIKLGIYVEKNKKQFAAHALSSLKKAMRWDEEYFGCEYDLDYMNIVAIKNFNSGACENKGLNIFNDKYILVDEKTATENDYKNVDLVVAHEYFHNWSGNKITIRDWFNLALKEGLTVYREQKYAETFYNKDAENIEQSMDIINSQFKYDNTSMAFPIIPKQYTNVRSIYHSTTYEKAAKIFKMLEFLVGEKLFNKAIRNFFQKYKGSAVTYLELFNEVQKLVKFKLDKFLLWFDIIGTPKLKITENYNESKKVFRLTIEHNKDRDLLFPLGVSLIVNNHENNYDLVVDNSYKTFTFENVTSPPVVIINPDFRAPVEVVFHQSEEDILKIVKTTKFDFARYKATQKLFLEAIIKTKVEYIQYLKEILLSNKIADEIKVKLLSIPTITGISDNLVEPNFDKAYSLKKHFMDHFAMELKSELKEMLSSSNNKELQNFILTCLSYLADEKENIINAYYNASEMTIKYNAFVLITSSQWEEKQEIINDFYSKYKDNHLVLNKWFAAVAISPMPDTISRIQEIIISDDFSFANPNNVFALLGSFARNPILFHKEDGSGYDFFGECVLLVDKVNPQIAAILVDFFGLYNVSESMDEKIKRALDKMKKSCSEILQDKIKKII